MRRRGLRAGRSSGPAIVHALVEPLLGLGIALRQLLTALAGRLIVGGVGFGEPFDLRLELIVGDFSVERGRADRAISAVERVGASAQPDRLVCRVMMTVTDFGSGSVTGKFTVQRRGGNKWDVYFKNID